MRKAIFLAFLTLALSGCSVTMSALGRPDQPSGSVDLEQSDEGPVRSERAEVIQQVLPSVVNVRVESLRFDDFGSPVEAEGQGSGVVIDEEGVIVTNNHVVAGAVDVTVVFNDGEHGSLPGEVVGTAPEHDLAVIRVEADDLDDIELGTSESLRLGDDVLAVGFPLGLGGPTVTKGIISAIDRTIEPEGAVVLQGLLQTDAAINPGNSGGALVDAAGRLIGINTAAAQAGVAENIGFAIPIDAAVPIVEEILSEPAQQRAWLGVYVATLDAPTAVQIGLDPGLRGVLVRGVVPGSPAEEAGVQAGDVLVRLEDEELEESEDLTRALTRFDPGDTVSLEIVSAAGSRTVEVRLASRPATFAPAPQG